MVRRVLREWHLRDAVWAISALLAFLGLLAIAGAVDRLVGPRILEPIRIIGQTPDSDPGVWIVRPGRGMEKLASHELATCCALRRTATARVSYLSNRILAVRIDDRWIATGDPVGVLLVGGLFLL